MTQMVASLMLTGDERGLIAATQRGEAGLDKLDGKLQAVERSTKSARDSALAFEAAIEAQANEVEQLRLSLDPVYAATRRLEAGQEILTRAQRTGAISTRQYEATLELLEQQHRQVTGAVNAQVAATKNLTFATAGGAGGLQNFSYQLQDIFTQVGMGVPLMISLGQQAPQILSGFGTFGAVAGVAAAAILPLSAAILGLGYDSDQTKEKAKSAADEIEEAFSAIATAQSTLRENSLTDLDAIKSKYGEVTSSVLTLLQAQNQLALQAALSQVREGIGASFSERENDLPGILRARQQVIQELRREVSGFEAQIEANISVDFNRRELEQRLQDLEDLANGQDLTIEFGVDEATLQNLAIYQNAIQDALSAQNYQGLLTVITQMRETLQDIPDGPLKGMFDGIVASETALREALTTADMTAATHAEIEATLQRTSGIDIESNIAAAANQASRMANELSRALNNAIALANQGVGAAETARINYEYRERPILKAQLFAEREFDSRTATTAALPDGAARQIKAEREEFVNARIEAAKYTEALKEWNAEQRKAASRSGGGGGGRRGGGGGRSGQRAAQEQERAIARIRQEVERLAPSYERDLAKLEEWRDEALGILNPAAAGYQEFADDVQEVFDARLAEIYKRDLERREDWAGGVERGFQKINEDLLTWADVGESIVTNWSKGLEDKFVELAQTGKFNVRDLVDFTIEQFLRMSYQMALQPAFQTIFSTISGAIGGAIGGSAPVTQSHSGSRIGARGVRRSYGPTSPLRADEQLTVTTWGQRVFTPEQIANGATVVDALAQAAEARKAPFAGVVFSPSIQVLNQSSTPVQGDIEERDDGFGGRSFRLVLADEVGTALKLKGGGANRTLRNEFGVRQVGTKR